MLMPNICTVISVFEEGKSPLFSLKMKQFLPSFCQSFSYLVGSILPLEKIPGKLMEVVGGEVWKKVG
jgi:hypothetical protein